MPSRAYVEWYKRTKAEERQKYVRSVEPIHRWEDDGGRVLEFRPYKWTKRKVSPTPWGKKCKECGKLLPLGWFRKKGQRNGAQVWQSRCRDCIRPLSHNRWAKRREILQSTGFNLRWNHIQEMLQAQRGMCNGWPRGSCVALLEYGYQIDHIVPLARGGRHELSNLQLLCRRCNTRKSDR